MHHVTEGIDNCKEAPEKRNPNYHYLARRVSHIMEARDELVGIGVELCMCDSGEYTSFYLQKISANHPALKGTVQRDGSGRN